MKRQSIILRLLSGVENVEIILLMTPPKISKRGFGKSIILRTISFVAYKGKYKLFLYQITEIFSKWWSIIEHFNIWLPSVKCDRKTKIFLFECHEILIIRRSCHIMSGAFLFQSKMTLSAALLRQVKKQTLKFPKKSFYKTHVKFRAVSGLSFISVARKNSVRSKKELLNFFLPRNLTFWYNMIII